MANSIPYDDFYAEACRLRKNMGSFSTYRGTCRRIFETMYNNPEIRPLFKTDKLQDHFYYEFLLSIEGCKLIINTIQMLYADVDLKKCRSRFGNVSGISMIAANLVPREINEQIRLNCQTVAQAKYYMDVQDDVASEMSEASSITSNGETFTVVDKPDVKTLLQREREEAAHLDAQLLELETLAELRRTNADKRRRLQEMLLAVQ